MALGIPTSNILQPGNISLTGGVTRQLVSDLQLLTPQYYKNYVEKYGSEDFTWWLSTYAGMEEVKNRDYFWFENRGKLITGVQFFVLLHSSLRSVLIQRPFLHSSAPINDFVSQIDISSSSRGCDG